MTPFLVTLTTAWESAQAQGVYDDVLTVLIEDNGYFQADRGRGGWDVECPG
jgi:hypothetical protein